MTGPISVEAFRDFIDPKDWVPGLPKGQGGTPVNLLCRELLKRGTRLVVLSCDASVTQEVVLRGDGFRLCIGPKGQRPARNFFRTEREYLAHAIAREKPDLIHAQWTYEYAMPAQLSGIPHVITAHDTPLRYLWHNLIPYRVARTMMAYRVITRAKRIVSVSPYVDEHLRKYMGYRGPARIIPNGMPDEVFVRDISRKEPRKHLTFASILVGWGAYKNGQAAIRAFAQVRRSLPEARLIMFGAGHGPSEDGQRWALDRQLQQGIEFVGHLDYPTLMRRLQHDVDILVHPSLVEAQPMALIEAMARGIPVIGGQSSGGVPWTLGDGEAGCLVDVRSPAAIAEAMIALGEDFERRNKLALAALEHAREKFHISSVADQWQTIYRELDAA